ncbi:MAG TPA: collagen-binding domain-containing protein [Verrucomicrobiae bacterium]|nr:collagen-binding domain-containing protein [Verrucomicrobiae bacterium]
MKMPLLSATPNAETSRRTTGRTGSRLRSRMARRASTLIAVLLLAVVIGGALIYYLAQVEQESTQVYRSQTWNLSLMMSEAGTEEAMAMINLYEARGDFAHITNWPSQAAANGWSQYNPASGVILPPNVPPVFTTFYKHHQVDANGYYDVYIDNSNPLNPVITSVGTAVWNFNVALGPHPMLAAAGAGVAAPPTIRQVQVKAAPQWVFTGAIQAKGLIDMNGKNVVTKSYNSHDPNHSFFSINNVGHGLYGLFTNSGSGLDPKQNANGDVQTDGAVIDVGNAKIYGHTDTAPGGNTQLNSQGSVGDTNWVSSGKTGIQPGYSSDDMNVDFPDPTLPNVSWTPVSGSSISSSGNYTLNSISGNFWITNGSPVPMVVNLYLSGSSSISLNGNSSLVVGTNVTVNIYCAGSIAIGGNGLANSSQYAPAVAIWGLSTCTSVSVGGNGSFYGTIYAPEAAVSMNGFGNNGSYNGALVANTVSMNGNSNFSYDEYLKSNGPIRGFAPVAWRELVGGN